MEAIEICEKCNTVYSPEFGECRCERDQSALDVQVGGEHYKSKGIQPIQYIFKNDLGFCEGNIVKYVTRYKDKNGVEDLKKAKHYIELLIEQVEKGQ